MERVAVTDQSAASIPSSGERPLISFDELEELLAAEGFHDAEEMS
jgi:hypothetical protein